jgi:acylphosphatase
VNRISGVGVLKGGAMMAAKHAIYRGRVQGVGFRFTAQRLAHERAISGTVRNCHDGSVELFVQGEASEVDSFLKDLGRQMKDYLGEQIIQDVEPTAVQGFHIVR